MPEKSINELPRDLRVLFTKGSDALQRENYDYAIDLFSQILIKEPAQFDVRRSLRQAQLRKAGEGKGFFKKMLSGAGSAPLVAKGNMVLSKNPAEALQIAEQILNSDPNNSGGHKLVVEAASAMDLPKTAVLSLEILTHNSPKDLEVAIKFARALADSGQAGKAEDILSGMAREYPGDNDLSQALKDISARKTLNEGGYEGLADGKGSYRDILKDKEEAAILEQQNRQVKTEDVTERLINEYETRLKTEPKNMKLVRSLAEMYASKKNFDKAMAYYDQLKASEVGADASLDKNIADTMARRFEHQLSQLDSSAPDYPEKAAKIQAEKEAFALTDCQKRAERFPTDLQIRFELGQLLFKAGKISEAIAELQKAQGNPQRRVAAMNLLAQCYAKRKMFELATRTFQTAMKEKQVFDEEKKDLVYNLAMVFEAMGKKEDAMREYQEIYAVDAGYRDVSAKMDAHFSGG